jgi:hypothetical protein
MTSPLSEKHKFKLNDWVYYNSPHYGEMTGIICEVFPSGDFVEVFIPARKYPHIWMCSKIKLTTNPNPKPEIT